MNTLHKIDAERRLYVIDCGVGYTCIGFDVAERHIQNVARYVGSALLKGRTFGSEPGTVEHFALYQRAMAAGAEHAARTRTRCEADLSPQLLGLEGKRVQVVDAEGDKPRRFRVGKSTGWYPIHLEIGACQDGGPGASRQYASVRRV